MNNFYYTIRLFITRHRFSLAFLMVLAGIAIGDVVAFELYNIFFANNPRPDISFAPEVWMSISALIIGTLVVIITIASQVVPRIIDVYMHDWRSLLYGWLMILCAGHAVLLNNIAATRTSSILLNEVLLMPLCIVLTFPYLFYILRYTKPNTIIHKIYNDCLWLMRELITPRMRQWIRKDDKNIIYCQKELFKYINQLDNIFYYVAFKELQAQIIINIGTLMREYIRSKENIINPKFFAVTSAVTSDIAFQTLEIQFQEIEESRTFFEQKCFRMLGDAYNKFLTENLFDLASLCGAEINLIGEAAIQTEDEYLMESIVIRFNTMMRSAFKHGVANQEARNLYNLAFHYSTYIKLLALNNRTELVTKAVKYLRLYGGEVFRNSQSQQALYFINDVFTFEMKEVLVLISELGWDLNIQKLLLKELLEMDNPVVTTATNIAEPFTFHAGVRTLQAGLALFYLKTKQTEMAGLVVEDIAKDLRKLEAAKAVALIETITTRLETAVPTFWEDTDRGNNNIYYSSNKEFAFEFQLMLMDSIQPDYLKPSEKEPHKFIA
jgi:hypothetical protein